MSSSPQFDQEQSLPMLPDGWHWLPLLELVDSSRGICYGIVQPGSHDPEGVPMVNSGDVFNGRVVPEVSFRVAVELHKKYRRSTLRGDEVLVTLVGANFGQVAIAPSRYVGHNCARPVGIVPVLENSRFVMYALRSPLLRQRMNNVANTTAQPTLNLKDLGRLPIPIPPARIRAEIADLLGAFDDRITLLRETNATLEAIAQALFKSWFVDFDPVHAKVDGRIPEGMDRATAALFPDSIEESELGLVPKGWQASCVSNLVSETSKRVGLKPALVLSAVQTGQLVRSAEHFTKRVHSEDLSKYKAVPPFAFAYNPSRINIGSIGMNEFDELGAVSPIYVVMAPRDIPKSFFLWHHLRTNRVRDAIISMSSGTVRQSLAFRDFASLPIVIPPDSLLIAFYELRMRLYESHAMNERLASTLSEARDTLLPRLISGQLRLPEAREELEANLP